MDTIQEVIGWAAAGLTVLYYLAPVEPFLRVLKGRLNFEDTPGVFVTCCYINCFVWYLYGDMVFSDQIKFSNLIASCISLILLIIYLAYELKKYLADSILNALLIITGTFAVYRGLTIIIDDDGIVGKICVGTTIIVFLTPIQILYKVIKEKNYILIPFKSSFIYLFASIAWIAYGILIIDYYLIFAHSVGIILSCIQIIVFLNYKRKFPAIGERSFSSTIGIETTGKEETKEETGIKIDENNQPQGKPKPVKIIITKNDS